MGRDVYFEKGPVPDTWLAQSEEYAALDLRVMSLSPILGIEIT